MLFEQCLLFGLLFLFAYVDFFKAIDYIIFINGLKRGLNDMSRTTDEWAVELGQHLRNLRLRQNIDQRQLAERAGVALNAVKGLEGGKGATVTSFIKVLRALGKEEWLGTLAPQVSISPLQMLKAKPVRQRASRVKAVTHV